MCSQIKQGTHGNFPPRPVDGATLLRNLANVLNSPVRHLQAVPHVFIPEAQFLEFQDQIAVDLQKVAREGLALEEIGNLRFYALISANDRSDGGCGSNSN